MKIKRFDKDIPLPEYKSPGAAAFDFYAREDVVIDPKGIGYVPLNVAIATPPGHFLLMAARSSLHKKGLILANGIGIFDPDFCGDEDEFVAALMNFTESPVSVFRGERITQGLLVRIVRSDWIEHQEMGYPARGGFGSTGNK